MLSENKLFTWDDASARWLQEQSHKSSLASDRIHIKWLDTHLTGALLVDISRHRIDQIIKAKVSEGVKNSTVNRVLEVLRAILRRSVIDWEWLSTSPRVPMLKEPLRRIRFITHSQAKTLLHELPSHLSAMAAFALATGLRRSNITGLQWSQVDLSRRVAWVHPDQAKARRAIAVPLNSDAVALIAMQIGKHPTNVFTYRGNVVRQTSTAAWYKALRRAGIENFRWHDLRHTWASWHVQGGTPIHVLQELGGWEDADMVRSYAHFSADHLLPYAGNLQSLMRVNAPCAA